MTIRKHAQGEQAKQRQAQGPAIQGRGDEDAAGLGLALFQLVDALVDRLQGIRVGGPEIGAAGDLGDVPQDVLTVNGAVWIFDTRVPLAGRVTRAIRIPVFVILPPPPTHTHTHTQYQGKQHQ